MSLKITMQECHITRDMPVIRTRAAREVLEDGQMIAAAVKANRFSAGDHILVQCMNHERTAVLCESEWVVASAATENKQVTRDDMTEHTVEQTLYKVIRKGDWWEPFPAEKAEKKKAA